VGIIWFEDRDINREMVREGHAWAYRDYLDDKSLLDDEANARDQGLGLWGKPGATAPWLYRRGDRSPTSVSGTTGYAGGATPNAVPDSFTCGAKKYCGEMTSCREAIFYLRKCRLTRLDADRDGVPCESICR
jgi:hypothetical protein